MDDMKKEQLEALEVMTDYIPKLLTGMKNVSVELTETKYEDTEEYLAKIIEGLNWVIEVLNGTLPLINEGSERINKTALNENILAFSAAFKEKNDNAMASLLTGSLAEFLHSFETAAKEVLAAN